MTIRIINAEDWKCIKPGDWLEMPGEVDRLVKIEINAEAPTRVDYVPDARAKDGQRYFLGVVQGMEKFEFRAGEHAALDFTSDGEVWYFTNDGAVTASPMPDDASFTKLLQRKSRSEQLEIIMAMQTANYERLLAAQRAENEELEAQLAAAEQHQAAASAASSVEQPAAGEPSSASAARLEPAAAGGGDGVSS